MTEEGEPQALLWFWGDKNVYRMLQVGTEGSGDRGGAWLTR